MLISDFTFIFYFMPGFYVLYNIFPPKARRFVLAAGGLLFYSWGRLQDAAIFLVLSLAVWLLSLLAARGRQFAYAGVALCVAALALFKYFDTPLGFPLGASFYIFHMISYLVDVTRGSKAEKDPFVLLAYLAMFPKLIMGPIEQYHDLAETVKAPVTTVQDTADGLLRFVVGLAKKALLAMQLAPMTEALWLDAPDSGIAAWMAAVCYSLQLYFDFSSYSDMAIGLGRMAGFTFKENFVYPYTSCSVSEFYRRWHASLGRWFRDYVYIPLGGSRGGTKRTLLNLMIVWALTGIWHGSSLNFLLWGDFLGVIICIEKVTGAAKAERTFLGWLRTTVLIVLSWVVFNASGLPEALNHLAMMFGASPFAVTRQVLASFHDQWPVLLGACIGCTPIVRDLGRRIAGTEDTLKAAVLKTALMCVLFAASLLLIVNSGYSAFIYTKF